MGKVFIEDMTHEDLIYYLRTMKITGLTFTEKFFIEEAIKRIERLEELEKQFVELMIKGG